MNKKCVFLDRDGVINYDYGYVGSIDDFVFIEGAIEGLQNLVTLGFDLIIVTNQSGIGRGFYSTEDFIYLMSQVYQLLKPYKISIKSTFFCPHAPVSSIDQATTPCDCRKPSPKLILEAIKKYNYKPEQCYMVGDRLTDMQAGNKAGIKNLVLLGGSKDKERQTICYSNFSSLLEFSESLL